MIEIGTTKFRQSLIIITMKSKIVVVGIMIAYKVTNIIILSSDNILCDFFHASSTNGAGFSTFKQFFRATVTANLMRNPSMYKTSIFGLGAAQSAQHTGV